MRKLSLFQNNRSVAVRLPKEFVFPGVSEMTIEKQGDSLVLRPVRPDWLSFAEAPLADDDFLRERPAVLDEERFALHDESVAP